MSITYLTPCPHRSQVTASSILVTVLAQNTQKEKTLSPTSGRPRRTTHCTERQGRLLLSSASIDFITHSPGNQKKKLKYTHQQWVRNQGASKKAVGKSFLALSLCFVCSSLGEKNVVRAGMTHAVGEASGPKRAASPPHPAPNAHSPTLPLPGSFFFHFFFFSRAPNPRHMTFC